MSRGIIIPDTHRPYHDKKAWRVFLKAARAFQPDWLVIQGDFADCLAVSRHSKDPRRATRLVEEIADVNQGLDELDSLGASEKEFIEGNHEDRLRRYLQDKAPELFGVVSIPELFRLRERGWRYTPYKEHRRFGKAHLTHDVGSAGRHSAFKALDIYHSTVVHAHTHRMVYVVEGTALGEAKLSCTFGWLGDREKVDYMQRGKVMKDSALGFGVGYKHRRTGIVYLTPVPIVNYTCVVEGAFYA